jgi:ADP-ribosylation factor-like protein 8
MWERYCRVANAIVSVYYPFSTHFSHCINRCCVYRYIVDSDDRNAIPIAQEELHYLLSKPSLDGIPLLVLGNKCDKEGHLTVDELIEQLKLAEVNNRKVSCYCISAKEETNLDAVLHWLIRQASD